jgi:hypothetical protein
MRHRDIEVTHIVATGVGDDHFVLRKRTRTDEIIFRQLIPKWWGSVTAGLSAHGIREE